MKPATRVGLFILGLALMTVALAPWPGDEHRGMLVEGNVVASAPVVKFRRAQSYEPPIAYVSCRPYTQRDIDRLERQCPERCGCWSPRARCKSRPYGTATIGTVDGSACERTSVPITHVRDATCWCSQAGAACVLLERMRDLEHVAHDRWAHENLSRPLGVPNPSRRHRDDVWQPSRGCTDYD